MALVRYSVAVAKGDMEPGEAALMIVKDTGKGAVVSYSTAFAGSQVQALMVKASTKVAEDGTKIITNTALKSLAESNLPAQIVTATIEVTKTMKKFFSGEIDGVECLTELGEKGTGMVASAVFAAIGQAVIPIPVVGGLVGGMVGYALSSAYYNSVLAVLKDAKFTRQERERIEAECAEAIEAIREWRAQFEKLVSKYMIDHIMIFHKAFDDIKEALAIGDIDGFIAGTNTITRKLGKTPQFETFNEFDTLMQNGSTFKL
jgi:phage tail tape-measure protein